MTTAHNRLSELVDTLHETYQSMRLLVGEHVDAVVHEASGATYLLPDAQRELRRTEGDERRHAAELAAVLDALPAQIALLDADGRIVTVNEAWRAFATDNGLGDADYAVGRNYLDICDAAHGRDADEGVAAAEGIRRVLAGSARRYTLEYPCHAPHEQRWFLLTVTPLDRENVTGAVVMHVDISERYRAHERTRELRQRLERLVDQAKVGILVHRNWVPILANRELARLLAYDSPEQIVALKSCRVIFAEDEHARIDAYNEARRRGGEAPGLYQVKGQRLDGQKLVMENRAFTIEWDGEMAVCAMLTDVTAQLDIEEQLRLSQRLDAVGQLTGGVAHDFNNLLTVILGNSELLAESLAHEPRLRNLAEVTAKAAERGAELTNRLLAFARRQPLHPKARDVNRQLAEMDKLLRRTLGEHVEIHMALAQGLWMAMVDAGQLENAILNLCINARDAMPGGGRLTIETANVRIDPAYAARQAEVDPGPYVMVAVSDTGAGMDEATRKRAFEPFFTTKEVGKGSGLGLSMVYGFVKQSGGHLWLYSEPGYGTTIKLYLPRAESEGDVDDDDHGDALAGTGSERILVVEDDDLVRDHVSRQLVSLGYQVHAVRNGPEAVQVLESEQPFDLLFTDVIMPGGMSGRDLAEQAKILRPGLPVLYTSGYSEHAIVHDGRLDPGVHLLTKPHRRLELARKVRHVLDAAGP